MGDETFDNTRGMDITRETISLNYYISRYWKIEIFEADLRPIERDVEGMCEDSEGYEGAISTCYNIDGV